MKTEMKETFVGTEFISEIADGSESSASGPESPGSFCPDFGAYCGEGAAFCPKCEKKL